MGFDAFVLTNGPPHCLSDKPCKGLMMLSQFPIFLDLHQTPPLVIGDDSGLAAKLRLLRKAAPIVDVMVSHHAEWPDQFADDSGARFHRLGDWQQARRFIQIHFQTMPDSRHSRFDQ